MDEELRHAIYNDIHAITEYQAKSSLFCEVSAKYNFTISQIEMLRHNLDEMVDKLKDAKHMLGLDLEHWERERDLLSGRR